jgi:hypothetical protein
MVTRAAPIMIASLTTNRPVPDSREGRHPTAGRSLLAGVGPQGWQADAAANAGQRATTPAVRLAGECAGVAARHRAGCHYFDRRQTERRTPFPTRRHEAPRGFGRRPRQHPLRRPDATAGSGQHTSCAEGRQRQGLRARRGGRVARDEANDVGVANQSAGNPPFKLGRGGVIVCSIKTKGPVKALLALAPVQGRGRTIGGRTLHGRNPHPVAKRPR